MQTRSGLIVSQHSHIANIHNPDAKNANAAHPNAREVENNVTIHDGTPLGNTGPRIEPKNNAPPPPVTQGGHIDLTRFT